MKPQKLMVYVLVAALIIATACQDTKEFGNNDQLKAPQLVLPSTPYSYNTGNDNAATLGRVLFYDPVLSINNTVSCGNCHKQNLAFSDDKQFSIGFGDRLTERNSMPIMNVNAMFSSGFFWDLRERTLDSMVVKPVQNHIEMGFDNMESVIAKISASTYYGDLFAKAYGDATVSQGRIQTAIATFLRACDSHKSKYDEGKSNNFANLTAEELRGKELLTEKLYCKRCHNGNEFRPSSYSGGGGSGGANIGLEMSYKDKGIKLPAGASGEGFFKIPTLRNIELTAPYMHDGRFNTLEEVIEHYNSGVKSHPNLSAELQSEEGPNNTSVFKGRPVPLNLSDGDKKALVAFLKTLTDYRFISDERFSNPFRVVN